jgi:hypothetical protein
LRSGRPRGPGKAFQNVGGFPPPHFRGPPGPRGRPDLKIAPSGRAPVAPVAGPPWPGPRGRPDCPQVPSAGSSGPFVGPSLAFCRLWALTNPPPGHLVLEALSDTVGKKQNIQIAQQLCPEGLWGRRLHNQSDKNVWGRRPHICFSLLLRNLGLQTFSGTILILLVYLLISLPFRGSATL